MNLIVIKGLLSIWFHLSFMGIESPKKSPFHCWKRMFGICDMQWWYVTQNRFLLRLTELYKWSGIIMVPKSKRQRLLVKFPISDSIPTSKLRNPRTTKKTSKVPETVLKKNLCSLYFILLQNLCCKNVDWLVVSNILLFSSLFGKDSHFDEYFSNGLVQPPTRLRKISCCPSSSCQIWEIHENSYRRCPIHPRRIEWIVPSPDCWS